MKKSSLTLFSVSTIALLALAGCGKTDKAADAPAASASATPAATAPAAAKPAEGRAIAITADDTMKFSTTEIHAKPGEALSVTLTNAGSVPKFSMGHNWVLLTANSDLNAFSSAASEAVTTDYVPASLKDQILASTKLLGPKESDTATFYAPQKPGHYPFLCTYPGHMQVGMKGELIVE